MFIFCSCHIPIKVQWSIENSAHVTDSGTQVDGGASISNVPQGKGGLGEPSRQQLHILSRSYTCTSSHFIGQNQLHDTLTHGGQGVCSCQVPGRWRASNTGGQYFWQLQQCTSVNHCLSPEGDTCPKEQLVLSGYNQNGNASVRVVLYTLVWLQTQLQQGQKNLISWLELWYGFSLMLRVIF